MSRKFRINNLPVELLFMILKLINPIIGRYVCRLWKDIIKSKAISLRPFSYMLVSTRQLNSLQYAHDNGLAISPYAYAIAAECGYLDVIIWLHKHNYPWDTSTCWFAAKNGYLDILKYAYSNECPVNLDMCASVAASRGHLAMAKWISDRQFRKTHNVTCVCMSAYYKLIELCKQHNAVT